MLLFALVIHLHSDFFVAYGTHRASHTHLSVPTFEFLCVLLLFATQLWACACVRAESQTQDREKAREYSHNVKGYRTAYRKVQ